MRARKDAHSLYFEQLFIPVYKLPEELADAGVRGPDDLARVVVDVRQDAFVLTDETLP